MAGKELVFVEQQLTPQVEIDLRCPTRHPVVPLLPRIRSDGKFFRCGSGKWFIKGLTYGPFAPDESGVFLPLRTQVRSDLAQIRTLGANCIRVYHTPPAWLLDEAAELGLRVFIDVPWQKHRCFLEDYDAQQDAIERVRSAAKLGMHPAVFAISVANEIPKDIVRFYGEKRIDRFIQTLVHDARQTCGDCLLTYTNYPSTEFVRPGGIDFLCFNVYLEDPVRLGEYLDRLQHLAGNQPLVLGEHGFDSLRQGEQRQAEQVRDQVERVFAHGLAGSFVFSFTDDWFAGGTQIENWAFGMTTRDRCEKPAGAAVRKAWSQVPYSPADDLPSVSVVVCSYNGAATLEECLRSLVNVRYPDVEIILVDDGSTDNTREIAARFPEVRYIHQHNRGLSAARNVGAAAARGQIVAYTDSDCVADEDWLIYLVHEMLRQNVDAIGGPNIPPPSDCQVARCVALSPGGPSHVMLDDRRAEHVPGCNMAFRREALLSIGGFDEQFRVAGDDVDVCWRLMDAGCTIGYAASAVVWHHRRSTVRAYLKQQAGYGRSEAMLYFKHPARFNRMGSALWQGVIYGEGAAGPSWMRPVIYHGRFGAELFPSIYRQSRVSPWAYATLLEWHGLAALLLGLSVLYAPLAGISILMWTLTVVATVRSGTAASVLPGSPWWSRGLVAGLHLLQPLFRAWHRYAWRIRNRGLPRYPNDDPDQPAPRRIAPTVFDLYWQSNEAAGREALLEAAVVAASERRWRGDFHCPWSVCDLMLTADNFHRIEVQTATEELGGPRRFTRARMQLRPTGWAVLAASVTLTWTALAVWTGGPLAQVAGAAMCLGLAARLLLSRRACRDASANLLRSAARRVGLCAPDAAPAAGPTPTAHRAPEAHPFDDEHEQTVAA